MVQRKSGVYIEEEDTLISVSRLCLHVQNEKVISKKVGRNQVNKPVVGDKGIKKFYQTTTGKKEEKNWKQNEEVKWLYTWILQNF